jgi:hypothetical protein
VSNPYHAEEKVAPLVRQLSWCRVQLPDKQLLQAKLHEFYAMNIRLGEGTE